MSPQSANVNGQKGFFLRPAQDSDAEAIGALGAHIFTITFGYSIPPSDLARYLEDAYSISAIKRDISNPNVTVTVACDAANAIIGFSQLRRDSFEPCLEGKPKPVELQRLYVSPPHHGQGLARLLVDDVQRAAREEGYQTLWLGVWEDNLKAQTVYRRFGFERCGEHDCVMGDCVQTDWILSKSL